MLLMKYIYFCFSVASDDNHIDGRKCPISTCTINTNQAWVIALIKTSCIQRRLFDALPEEL